jgi:hypothetical protein
VAFFGGEESWRGDIKTDKSTISQNHQTMADSAVVPVAPSRFQDTSTDCAICLSPLDEEEVVELACGHRWHFECLKEQLEHAQPNHAKRLLFSGCQCAKCGAFCDHPALQHLTRKTDALRERVDAMIAEQLENDAPDVWKRQASLSASHATTLVDEARRKYAFYQCNSCNEPYFGGTIECADQEEGELAPQDRLCVGCAPQPQTHCENLTQHRGHLVWKCRYCCRDANYVCYGTVHFCSSCHDRNSQRVRRRQQMGHSSSSAPPPLEPIPCPGESCPYPKSPGQACHTNGPTSVCEQVFYCASCVSRRTGGSLSEELPGSSNLLLNSSGQNGLQGWQQLSRGMSWKVEHSDLPPSPDSTTNFVSCHNWCIMAQSVSLHQWVFDPSQVRIEVSAKYMGRTDCPSVFRLEGILLDSQQRPIRRETTRQLEAPPDSWERASLVLEPTPDAHQVLIVVHGKDARFWQGNFGSKVANCSVRVLGASEALTRILRNPIIPPQPGRVPLHPQGVQNRGVVLVPRVVDGGGGRQARQRLEPDAARRVLLYEMILPIVCFVVFAWLIST